MQAANDSHRYASGSASTPQHSACTWPPPLIVLEALRSESLSPGHRWIVGTSRSSLYRRVWHSRCSDLPRWFPARKVLGACSSPGHQGNRQGLVADGPCQRPREVGMLFAMKQCVGFVAGQGMPGAWLERRRVVQESPGLPGHCEEQVRQSMVGQSLHRYLCMRKGKTDRQCAMIRQTSDTMSEEKDENSTRRWSCTVSRL